MLHLSPGEDSGKVMIWNMAPVLREEDEKNENIPKMLCQMDNHLGNSFISINVIVDLVKTVTYRSWYCLLNKSTWTVIQVLLLLYLFLLKLKSNLNDK